VAVLRADEKITPALPILSEMLNHVIMAVEDRHLAAFRHRVLPPLTRCDLILPRKTNDVFYPLQVERCAGPKQCTPVMRSPPKIIPTSCFVKPPLIPMLRQLGQLDAALPDMTMRWAQANQTTARLTTNGGRAIIGLRAF
jgi:hypothetical protein